MVLQNHMSACMRWSTSTLIRSVRIVMMGSAMQMPMLTSEPCVSRRAIASNTSSQDVAASEIHAHGLMIVLSTQMERASPKAKASPQERKETASQKETLPKALRKQNAEGSELVQSHRIGFANPAEVPRLMDSRTVLFAPFT